MTVIVDPFGNRYMECAGCGAHGPHRVTFKHARASAAAAGWTGDRCPECTPTTTPKETP